MQFEPAILTVKRGERVRWTNQDPFPHTVTADSGAFESGEIAPQAGWTYTPRKAGQFPYGCRLHPTMKALLVVM